MANLRAFFSGPIVLTKKEKVSFLRGGNGKGMVKGTELAHHYPLSGNHISSVRVLSFFFFFFARGGYWSVAILYLMPFRHSGTHYPRHGKELFIRGVRDPVFIERTMRKRLRAVVSEEGNDGGGLSIKSKAFFFLLRDGRVKNIVCVKYVRENGWMVPEKDIPRSDHLIS